MVLHGVTIPDPECPVLGAFQGRVLGLISHAQERMTLTKAPALPSTSKSPKGWATRPECLLYTGCVLSAFPPRVAHPAGSPEIPSQRSGHPSRPRRRLRASRVATSRQGPQFDYLSSRGFSVITSGGCESWLTRIMFSQTKQRR